MKAKVNRGDGFRGVLNYSLNSEKRPEIIGGTIAGLNARQLAAEFGYVRKLRPDAKRPVWHCSLSLPPGDHLTGERWDAVVADFMKEMGFSESTPYIAIRHRDTDKDHVHIVASRINLNGELWHGKWEARTAIEATQSLERKHGLTLTPGLDAASGRKQLKKGEVEMALRKGEQPPKLKLQNIIDEALNSGELTAVQFAETLELSGVEVKANLASTGTFNGFSYQLDGVAFKGSKLGKAYGWGGIKERGVSYEQARDYQGLSRFAAASAGAGDKRAIRESWSNGRNSNDVREHQPSATSSSARVGGRNQHQSNTGTTAAIADVERQDGHIEQHINKGGESSGIPRESPKTNKPSGMEGAQLSGSDTAPTLEETVISGSGGGSAGQPANNRWNARFKASSAKARDRHAVAAASGQSNTARDRVNQADIQQARQIDPSRFFEQMGYKIKRDGRRHFSVRIGKDEAYRLTQKPDGVWLWLDNRGNAGGDNIDLVKELTGLKTFVDCVYELVIKSSSDFDKVAPPPAPQPPRIPNNSEQGQWLGRMYLEERGISLETTQHAERSGFLRYLNDGLLFVGRKAGQILNATKRAFSPDAAVQKRDLAGSDKQYPPILSGNPKTIWIVEGGVDALALHDIAKRKGAEPPTVIVSGGAGVLSFFDNPEIQQKIKAAAVVVVAKDNEKDADTQAKTDAMHSKQVERARELNPDANVVEWQPGLPDIKDVAALNALNEYQQQRQRPPEPVLVAKDLDVNW